MARMRNCPRCNTSIGETLIVCPACDLPNPFSSPTVEEEEAAAPDYVRSSSCASVSTNTSRSRSLAAAGGWAGIVAFIVWNVAGAIALAFAIGGYSSAHCNGDQTCVAIPASQEAGAK